MEMTPGPNIVDAIDELRDAVAPSGSARDALLAAQLDVEAKTDEAIEVCQACGHRHPDDAAHQPQPRGTGRPDNVIYVDFRPNAKR